MKRLLLTSLAISLLASSSVAFATRQVNKPPSTKITSNTPSIDEIIATWPERPRLGARQMLAKYGAPQEATGRQLVWHNAGPFKRITVYKLETPHDFPMPHVDYLEHTIEYDVPQDKVADLIRFDASSTINRTVGELSARCDLEGHNILTLNLDHDIVMGKKSVEQARKAFGDIVVQDVTGKHPPYVEALQFTPAKATTAAFSDSPVIPGSPLRINDTDAATKPVIAKSKSPDSEVLATILAVDLNEVLAAAEAKKKRISQPVLDYAKMLHVAHGANMVKGMMVGERISVVPIDTTSVDRLKQKGAGELASLVALEGNSFERAYIDMMIKGHGEVLSMIDSKLSKVAQADALKSHLTESRQHVAAHLEQAKALQAKTKR